MDKLALLERLVSEGQSRVLVKVDNLTKKVDKVASVNDMTYIGYFYTIVSMPYRFLFYIPFIGGFLQFLFLANLACAIYMWLPKQITSILYYIAIFIAKILRLCFYPLYIYVTKALANPYISDLVSQWKTTLWDNAFLGISMEEIDISGQISGKLTSATNNIYNLYEKMF